MRIDMGPWFPFEKFVAMAKESFKDEDRAAKKVKVCYSTSPYMIIEMPYGIRALRLGVAICCSITRCKAKSHKFSWLIIDVTKINELVIGGTR